MLLPPSCARLWAPKRDVSLDEVVKQSLGVLLAEFSGAGSMVAGGPFFLLPIFNARSRLLRRGLEMLEIGKCVTVASLPLLFFVTVAKLEGCRTERAFGAGILPDTDMY